LNTEYTGFSIYGRALCLVVDPPGPHAESLVRKKKARKERGGIEEWFVNMRGEEAGIDDT
jgi:hypothetical protein